VAIAVAEYLVIQVTVGSQVTLDTADILEFLVIVVVEFLDIQEVVYLVTQAIVE